MRKFFSIVVLGALVLSLFSLGLNVARADSTAVTFAVIGDYGVNNGPEAAVANMVASWTPDFVITTGDNYYVEVAGTGSQKYDISTGKYYCAFLKDVTTTGAFCPQGTAATNRFFPAVGDHDYLDGGTTDNLPTTYADYFNLPGVGFSSSSNNERYYDYVQGPVHFFVVNSNGGVGQEPDGVTSTSIQGEWLRTQLQASISTWNIVYFSEPPYSSGTVHGSQAYMQWPFAQWGADAVFSGDDHVYERILRDGIVYFVNGMGGQGLYPFGTPVEGSAFRYNTTHGAQRVIISDTSMTLEFYSVDNGGTLRDSYTIYAPGVPTPTAGTAQPGNINLQVSSSTDDAEMDVSDGSMYLYNSDLEMINDPGLQRVQKVGLRFLNVSIPHGALITNAYIEFEVMSANSEATSLTVRAQASDNAVTFKNIAYDLTSRPLTSAVVSWNSIPAWTVIGAKQQTPNLAALVQEVVDRPGWVVGNNIAFVIDGFGTRTAASFDGDVSGAPVLHVEFDPPPTPTPTATFTPSPTAMPTLPANTTGWLSPSAQAGTTSGDGNGYEVSATNVFADDSVFAADMNSGTTTSTSCSDAGKDRHKFYNYGLSAPAGATIFGIEVRLDARTDSTVGTPKLCTSLSWDKGVSWTAWKSTSTITTNEATYILGGPADVWGHAWTTAELGNSTFQLRVVDVSSDITRDFSLDWVGVKVTFNPPYTPTANITNTPLLPTATPTETSTPLPPSATSSPTETYTPGPPTFTPTITDTPLPATDTSTPTETHTPLPPTDTATPTLTFTPLPPTTATYTPTPTSTLTPQVSTTGWRSPVKQVKAKTNAGDNNGFELNPVDAFSVDGLFAGDIDSGTTTSTNCSDIGKDKHRYSNYNVSVPTGAIILGIEVRLDTKADSTIGTPKMCISLSKDNGSTWTSWKTTPPLTTTVGSYFLGSPSDLWGLSWIVSDLSNSRFQIRIANVSSDLASDFFLDWIAVNVTYQQ